MTEEDYAKLMARVKKSGMTQAEFLRTAILHKNIVSSDGINLLVPELKRIGVNVNQIARCMNQNIYVSDSSIKLVSEELNKIWQQLRLFVQKQA
jgi:hypothetical protein